MKESIRDALFFLGIFAFIITGLAGVGYLSYISDIPVEKTGKVIGTYVEPSGFSSRTICVIEVDGERYDTTHLCTNLIGDIVKVNKYKHYVTVIRD